MFGLDVLLWGVEQDSSKGILKMLKNHYGYGGYGHAAMRLTLPVNEETQQWVEKYCYMSPSAVKPTIPFVKTTTLIRDPDAPFTAAKEVPCYEVYFSWWPGQLHNEFEDSISQVNTRQVSYAPKWKEALYPDEDVPKHKIHSGSVGKLLNSFMPRLMNWSLTNEAPTMEHVHVNDKQTQEHEVLRQHEKYRVASLEALIAQISELPSKDKYRNQLCKQYKEELQNLYTIRHELYAHTTLGVDADHTFHFPIKISDEDFGLDAKAMLEMMHEHITEYEFDIIWLNCSAASRFVMLHAIEGQLEQTFKDLHGVWQLMPNIIDNPTSLFNFCIKLDAAVSDIRLQAPHDRAAPILMSQRTQAPDPKEPTIPQTPEPSVHTDCQHP